jgi:hypothetical protein
MSSRSPAPRAAYFSLCAAAEEGERGRPCLPALCATASSGSAQPAAHKYPNINRKV